MYSPSHLEVAILNYLNENDITVPIKGVLQEAIHSVILMHFRVIILSKVSYSKHLIQVLLMSGVLIQNSIRLMVLLM